MGKASIKRKLIAGGLATALVLQRLKLMETARGLGAIFTLHQVRPYNAVVPDPNRHLEITPQFLAVALRTLWRENYEFIRLEDVPERLAQPSRGRPFAAFTLDDAYHNAQSLALPVFESFEAPLTVFVCQGLSTRSHSLWWDTLSELVRNTSEIEFSLGANRLVLATATPTQKQLAFGRIAACIAEANEADAIAALNTLALQHGIDAQKIVENNILSTTDLQAFADHPLVSLGAHSVSHRAMTKLSDDDLHHDIVGSADYVESLCGRRPTSFAYPYGDARSVDVRTVDAVRKAGFQLAVTTKPGTVAASDYNRLHNLPRISLNGHFQTPSSVKALASGIPFKLL